MKRLIYSIFVLSLLALPVTAFAAKDCCVGKKGDCCQDQAKCRECCTKDPQCCSDQAACQACCQL